MAGSITANNKCIQFSPSQFTGNSQTISYDVNIEGYSKAIGEVITTSALVSSNGGEAIIPVVIKISTEVMKTSAGIAINTLKDFYQFAKKSPKEARMLFNTEAFKRWLGRIEFEHMDMFQLMQNDKSEERALDNFFILTNQKKKTDAFIDNETVDVTILPQDENKTMGTIHIKKSDGGYMEGRVLVEGGAPWLTLHTDTIRSKDFDEHGEMEIFYTIDPMHIHCRAVYDTIALHAETTTRVDVNVKRLPPCTIRMSSESYYFADDGYVDVYNNTTKDLKLEIETKDNFVKFEGKSYFISKNGRIPFKIKMPLIQQKQMDFKKKPYVETEIYIKIYTPDGMRKRTEKFLVGYSLL